MTPSDELKIIARKHAWAIEELVTDSKMIEANKLISAGNKAMFEYLKQYYGSGMEALDALRSLLQTQTARRKTLSR